MLLTTVNAKGDSVNAAESRRRFDVRLACCRETDISKFKYYFWICKEENGQKYLVNLGIQHFLDVRNGDRHLVTRSGMAYAWTGTNYRLKPSALGMGLSAIDLGGGEWGVMTVDIPNRDLAFVAITLDDVGPAEG